MRASQSIDVRHMSWSPSTKLMARDGEVSNRAIVAHAAIVRSHMPEKYCILNIAFELSRRPSNYTSFARPQLWEVGFAFRDGHRQTGPVGPVRANNRH